MQREYTNIFDRVVSPENLFAAWREFRRGKAQRKDVLEFEWKLEEQLLSLHRALASGTYRHDPYADFTIRDPKQRRIHKATVRDRIVHHAIFSVLNPIFEPAFIAHSYSCRVGKGTHRAVDTLERMLRNTSRNHTRPCFALKCDIHKFFASVDHGMLLNFFGNRIKDERAMALLQEIVGSFHTAPGKGIPIGNLTSQLFANVYLHELDWFIKHKLRIKHYIRYTDDFVAVAEDEAVLRDLLPPVRLFLHDCLRLQLHPRKVTVRKYRQGIDFLGYVVLPHHRVLRTRTKRRMFRKMREKAEQCERGIILRESMEQSLQSYLGVLSHANAFRLSQDLRNVFQ
ncbi:MAG: reverse transcriptase/maturase family protein [Patescibacteria group bacterium]